MTPRAVLSRPSCVIFMLLLATAATRAQLEVEITGCTPPDPANTVTLQNIGSQARQVDFITAAFRGFVAAPPPSPDPAHPCADVSFWEKRFDPPLTVLAEGSVFLSLRDLLPDNFGTAPQRRADQCTHLMLSVSARSFVNPADPPEPESAGACKFSLEPTFPETTISVPPGDLRVSDARHALVATTGLIPAANTGASSMEGVCFDTADMSGTMLHNRSEATTYQGIYAGRFVCKTANDREVSPGTGDVCFTGPGAEPDQEILDSPNEGAGIRGAFRGFRLASDRCGGFRVNPGGGFPNCCDCIASRCAAPVVVQCGRTVVTGELVDPATNAFAYYEPFIFLDFHSDLEPRTNNDLNGGGSNPNPKNLQLQCRDFAFSDIPLFTHFIDFNFNRFDFDSSMASNGCENRQATNVGAGMVTDRDLNGVADECQFVLPSTEGHNLGGGGAVTVRRRIRNLYYDGTQAGSPVPSLFGAFEAFDFGGRTAEIPAGSVLQHPDYGERLTLEIPIQLLETGEDRQMTLRDLPAGTDELVEEPFRIMDWLFVGSHQGTTSGALSAFDSFSGTRRAADLNEAAEGSTAAVLPVGPVTGLAAVTSGPRIYVGAGQQVFVYDNGLRRFVDAVPGGALDGLSVGTDVAALTAEPDDQFVYAATGSVTTVPGEGWFAVIDPLTDSLISGTQGSSLIGEIVGTPLDIAVINVDTGTGGGSCGEEGCHEIIPQGAGMMSSLGGEINPDRETIAYVSSVVVEPGTCSGQSGGYHRRLLLSTHRLGRPDFALSLPYGDSVEVSCLDTAMPEGLTDAGLDVVDVVLDRRIFVVSPDTGELVTVQFEAGIGTLIPTSIQRVATLGTAGRPTDVAVSRTVVTELDFPIAMVVGSNSGTGQGRIDRFNALTNPPAFDASLSLGPSVAPVAVILRGDLREAYVAQQGDSRVRVVQVDQLGQLVDFRALASSGTTRRLVVQRLQP